jgi:hypothetical protein
MPYPLVTSANPLAFALRVFDDNPDQEQQQPHIEAACNYARLRAPLSGAPVARGGAHALYAAWLAAKRAAVVYDKATCNRCCFNRSFTVYNKTIKWVAVEGRWRGAPLIFT